MIRDWEHGPRLEDLQAPAYANSYRKVWLNAGRRVVLALRAGATADDVERWLRHDLMDWLYRADPEESPPQILISRG
jgi:hypothetical protein